MRQGGIAAALLGLGLADPAQAETIVSGGLNRTYDLHVPASVAAAGRPVPLVIVLHGGMGTGVQIRGWFGLDAIADRDGFLVVYPDGISRNWNDGRTAITFSGQKSPPDDVTFLSELVAHLVQSKRADAKNVFVTGASNGGMMSYRLACETAGVFAGYAAMIANVSTDLAKTCAPRQQAAMLIMNGTDDPLMPFNGGSVARNNRGSVTSTAETFERFRKLNGCTAVAKPVARPDKDQNDGSTVEVTSATGCATSAPTVLYTVVGGGHQMPSIKRGSRPMIDRFLGRNNRDIEAAEEVWAFFKSAKR